MSGERRGMYRRSGYLDREPRSLAEAERDQLRRLVGELVQALNLAAATIDRLTCGDDAKRAGVQGTLDVSRAALEIARQVTGTTRESGDA